MRDLRLGEGLVVLFAKQINFFLEFGMVYNTGYRIYGILFQSLAGLGKNFWWQLVWDKGTFTSEKGKPKFEGTVVHVRAHDQITCKSMEGKHSVVGARPALRGRVMVKQSILIIAVLSKMTLKVQMFEIFI